MCGIAGIHRRTDKPITEVNRLADNLLIAIEHRGRDASGYLAMFDNGRVQVEKRTDRAALFVRDRQQIRADARTVLLHTRYATVGAAADPRNAHPVINGTCAAVHNGTIYNHDEVFATFGMKRHAEVDSEVIPAIVNYAGWANAAEALDLLEGGAATAIVNEQHPTELILARLRDFPLVVAITDDLVMWASERSALATAYRMTYGWDLRGDRYTTLDEWTMLRVNGTVETTRIRAQRRPAMKGRQGAARTVVGPAKTNAGKAAKARRKKSRRAATEPLWHEQGEQWTEDAVRDLMRWSSLSRDEAYEAVYGTTPPDWIDDMFGDG